MTLSGSKMGLARHCLYWVDKPATDGPAGDAAANGTWYHAFVAWGIETICGSQDVPDEPPNPPACLGDSNEWSPMDDAHTLINELLGNGFTHDSTHAEAAYLYSPRKTHFLGFDIGRDYGEVASDEIPCSLDVVALSDTRAVVVDWKTGRRENVEPVETNAQLAFGALCVSDYHGVTDVEVQIRFADGGVWRHTYDAFDLADIRAEVNALIATVDRPPRPGLHCTSKWCPIRATCPKTVEVVAELCTDGDAAMTLVHDVSAITSPDHAGHMYHRAAAARVLLDQVDSAIKAYVEQHGPVPLGDGKEYCVGEETRESIGGTSPQEIYAPIEPFLSPEDFAACIAVSVPKGSLEKAVKAAATGPKGQTWNEAMEALRSAGLVRAKTITRHKVRTAK